MKQEKSCGAVVFRDENNVREYLIERMRQGHFALCKGHVEKNETEHETAEREILEETGLTVQFIGDFRTTTGYCPSDGVYKEVVYFLAKTTSNYQRVQLSEVSEIIWLPYPEAIDILTYKSDKEILRQAKDYLEGENK